MPTIEVLEREVEWLRKVLAEYGGPRCTAACPPKLDGGACAAAHWCLLAGGHDGPHRWACQFDALRREADHMEQQVVELLAEIRHRADSEPES